MNKIFLAVFILICAGIGGYFLLWNQSEQSSTPPITSTKTYTNTAHGISFSYPADYVLTEGEHGNGERTHYAVVLMKQEDTPVPENGEGPTTITIDMYQNNSDNETLLGWLNGNASSNYKIATAPYAATTIAGKDAIRYPWSGLYEGETTAFLQKDDIIAVSVTFMSPNDEKIAAYRALLDSIQLQNN